ncbi:anthranilate synthase component I family protein [Prolixibacter denitrificans]|uniref:Anthranilate synthase component 1 n=1 Tax=Prolixibacter denitrificans TaxID=1541063 RepID=A0A2P8CI31_9BACT|nr:anthranilate synthase component I family protein [Prolixibacter denitrificans]PSK84624.1 anthranilate synthase component 1 [Prolixibacter denitrificans]GET20790.1 anthranilate synthase component I [Prolixibacter denitrificans]
MKTIKFSPRVKEILADTVTPVSIYLKLRDIYPNTLLLESSDYHGNENSYSFICIKPEATFMVEQNNIRIKYPHQQDEIRPVEKHGQVADELDAFFQSFKPSNGISGIPANGLFGYVSYDGVQYFETIKFKNPVKPEYAIPEIRYSFYRYIIAINHHMNRVQLIENLPEGEEETIAELEGLLANRNYATFTFDTHSEETSNITDEAYKEMVTRGKEHCHRGDVFQIVLSRQYNQPFHGDEFNVYRALRNINPSPYLFYFDYGDYKIFGSSPEAQLQIKDRKVSINPIAGTFRRTGDDEQDRQLAEKLAADPKENAEHVMLVDLARNDLSRNAENVEVEQFREVQYYSHVIHLVSKVSGYLPKNSNAFRVNGDSFPAGTLSGAPKYRAMELIDQYENQNRGYYGGCIGYIGFDNHFNHAIMIRSFLSKNATLYYQAGAGIVSESNEENELQEVNNKLAALKKAIQLAREIQ